MRESLGAEKPTGAMKVKPSQEGDGGSSPHVGGAHSGGVASASSVRRTVSAHVGTRKMVNYAWLGRSQRKLWWRLAAILTCKSIVGSGYRGERLIEPSSSWFPPKFPSG